MSIEFNGTTIAGINSAMNTTSPQFRAVRTHHWGVEGETEIVGKNGGRDVTFTLLHFNSFTDIEDLLASLQTIDALIGTHGTLKDLNIDLQAPPFPASTPAMQFPNCTFEMFQEAPLQSQPFAGPLLDDAGCLDGGWFINLQFKFRQLLTTPNGRRIADV